MSDEYYCLIVVNKNGGEHRILGRQKYLESIMESWSDRSSWNSENDVLRIEGVCDSADQAPLRVSIESSFVGSMALFRH